MIIRLFEAERDHIVRRALLLELEEKVQRAMAGEVDLGNWAVMRCAELRKLGDDAKPYITWRRDESSDIVYETHVRVNGFVERNPRL